MSKYKAFKLEKHDDGVAVVSFDLPERSMNVIGRDVVVELGGIVESLAADAEVRGIVLASGKSSFCAGADLLEIVDAIGPQRKPADEWQEWAALSQICRRLETCGKPVAAAINGTALGGGLELCLACHHRVAANNAKAKFGLPEVQVGLMPGAGGTQRLPRLLGLEKSLPLLVQGRHVSVAEAAELGMIDSLVDAGTEIEAAKRWILEGGSGEQPWDRKGFRFPGGAGLMHPKAVQTQMIGTALLQKETKHNYPAPIAIMSAVYEGSVLPMDTALALESKFFAELLATVEARNMVRSLFVNKGEADKLVRRPQDIEPSRVSKLGILGAGMMGAGIAFVAARAGIEVVLLDRSTDDAEQGKDYSRQLLTKRVDRGRMSAEESAAILDRISPTDDYGLLTGCDYVIEAVFEDRDVKARVTGLAEAAMPATAIFGSNTSTLPISSLAETSGRPAQFIGIHFFSPVDKMPLVEVIVGEQTGDEAIARTLDFVQQIRKTPIVVRDGRGFYTSRVFGTYTREGMAMLAEGVNPALIENVARHAGMPVGPLEVTDEVSLELAQRITLQTQKDLGDAYVGTPADDVLQTMVEELERRGKRFAAGFYDYPDDGPKRLWPGLGEHFPPASEQPEPAEVRRRLLYIQAIESVRCLEEGVLQHAADGDVGSILGWGFPPYTGGVFSLIESVGVAQFVAEAEALAERYGPRFAAPALLLEMRDSGTGFYDNAGDAGKRTAA